MAQVIGTSAVGAALQSDTVKDGLGAVTSGAKTFLTDPEFAQQRAQAVDLSKAGFREAGKLGSSAMEIMERQQNVATETGKSLVKGFVWANVLMIIVPIIIIAIIALGIFLLIWKIQGYKPKENFEKVVKMGETDLWEARRLALS